MVGSFRRKVEEWAEKESREETLRIAGEWDKLSTEEKGKKSIAAFFSQRLMQFDREREARREVREACCNDPNLFRLLYIPFGYILYFDCE